MRSIRTLPLSTVLCLAALLLSACGGGGAGSVLPSTNTALTIMTSSLPGGSVGAVFPTTLLDAVNEQGSTRWQVAGGALPEGLSLSVDGVIAGTPTTSGTFPFVADVRDDVASDTQTLTIVIGHVDLTVASGLVLGDAWSERALTLTTSGVTGSVAFSIESNGSGGSLSHQNAAAGTAIWTPGTTGGATTVDVLRVTDQGNGETDSLAVPVMRNPTATHTAAFGMTDVWWIDPAQKFGSHAYASDLHAALVDVGLRAPTSTGATGTEADELALLYFRVEVLRRANPMFLRNADGTAGAQGLAISFTYEEPGAGYSKPASGAWLPGSPLRYSQMGLVHGSASGVIGTAFLDSTTNGSHENDTTAGAVELGVFANQMVPLFNQAYANTLRHDPIAGEDVAVLKALLYGLPSPGGRYDLIARIGAGFARTVAATVAHEVGHSLGLPHTSPSQSGSIMNPAALISPSASYSFLAADISALRNALPGAGKMGTGPSGARKHAHTGPDGGLMVCGCRTR